MSERAPDWIRGSAPPAAGRVEDHPRRERVWIERARHGDKTAFEELVRRHQAVAFRAAYLITGDAHEAEDAVQEGLVKAWRALSSFRPEAPLRPWLLRIVANQARNRRRAQSYRLQLRLRAGAEPTLNGSPSEPSDEAVERRDRLLAAINALPDRQRLVFAYRYVVGLSEEETAEALQLPLGTVKSRTSRALDKLRDEL